VAISRWRRERSCATGARMVAGYALLASSRAAERSRDQPP
jgi:hypothetical protein